MPERRTPPYLDRRTFLAASLAGPLLRPARAAAAPEWRTFDIVTQVDLPGRSGAARAWVPLPSSAAGPYQRTSVPAVEVAGGTSRLHEDGATGTRMIAAEWTAGAERRVVVRTRVETRDHQVALVPGSGVMRPPNLERYLQPSALIPTDGIVADRARAITRGQTSALGKARAIYDWVVEQTVRDPEVKGCGLGDIRWMLETGNLRGKCADINALFVGLARAVGLPARDLYGLRVAPSRELASLGRTGGDVTTAQHCRAEVFVEGIGWIPVDPADVRKVLLDEPGVSGLADPRARQVRERLFGSWEMNWVAYNDAHDVLLPGSAGPRLPFLMYPQAEIDGARRDSLDPASFRYSIAARELD